MTKLLEFEKPIFELYSKIDDLKRLGSEGQMDLSAEIEKIEQRAERLKQEIYNNLLPNQILQIARHPDRPDALSLISRIFTDFVEMHGDRLFGDDPAIVGGLARIDGHSVMVIGHQKGHDTKDNIYRNFAMANPEGYRKALRLMKIAQKYHIPVITFIDTKGAFPGIGAEERGQAEAIARNLMEMANFTVPIIGVLVGEGGSGGALAIGVVNKMYMLQYSVYSVISPEGCASILFRDSAQSARAAEAMGITAEQNVKLGIADGIIPEPVGGAHYDVDATAAAIKSVLLADILRYRGKAAADIMEERYAKYRQIGFFHEPSAAV